MSGRLAGILFLAFCVVLAVLLLAGWISAETTGWSFAVAMVVFGLLSRGFGRS